MLPRQKSKAEKMERKAMASKDIKDEEADPLAPQFRDLKNDLERTTGMFKEIVLILDFSEASKKNKNPSSHQSLEASKKNDEANPLALCSQWIKKKFEECRNESSTKASKKKDGANPPLPQSSESSKKKDEERRMIVLSKEIAPRCQWIEEKKLNPLFEAIDSKWDSSMALRSRWIKKKLEKLEAQISSWEDILDQVSALVGDVDNLVSDNDGDKLNRVTDDIQRCHQRIRNLVTTGMTPALESIIRRMISEAIQKNAGSLEEGSSFQRIKKELQKMIAGVSERSEDNILSLVEALIGKVNNLVAGPYDNHGDILNHIIDDIQRIRNLVTPGTAPDLECRILKISEAIQKKEASHTEEESRFQKIKTELERMMAQFHGQVSTWEEYLLSQVTALERDVDNLVTGPDDNNGNIGMKLNSIIGDLKSITKLVTPVRPINIDLERGKYQPEEASAKKVSKAWQRLPVEKKIVENANVENLKVSFDNLEKPELKLCLLFLSIFPENSVIKKRPLIYWWIGEGLIKEEQVEAAENERENKRVVKTAEEVGEEIFMKFIAENLIIAKFDNEWNGGPVVNRCEVHPWIRHMLISLATEAQLFLFDSTGTQSWNTSCRRACLYRKSFLDKSDQESLSKTKMSDQEAAKLCTVFNVNERYPRFSDDWLMKLKNVVALQLGRWQGSVTSVQHHIEMENNILKDLGTQKHLKCLSLRGISGITQLPDSIVNLISLEILDLRACHNLEKLPKKIASLRKLTHLDVSECYLLESMPRGLEKLIALQVLKGFVVGHTNETSCRIGSLHNLEGLKRLSIRMGKMTEIKNEELGKLKEIKYLRCLTISWGKDPEDKQFSSLSFPENLEKLDLRGIRIKKDTDISVKKAPGWLQPSKLQSLKKLYIRGGELDSLDSETGETGIWKVEILILKHLKHLEIKLPQLQEKFPCLKYLEKIECHGNDKVVWDKSKEEKQRHAAAGESAASSSMS